MPENSYEVVSGKSDTLIGTYASMEYQLRQQNKNDLNRLQQRREALLKKMIELKNSLLKYLVMPPNLNQQLISKIVSKMTAEEIRRYLKKEAAALDILTEVSAYEAEFLQLALQQKFKESRLMYTEATKNYADFTGNKLYSTHNELVHLKSDTITALDREIVFINSRDCRAAKIPHDLDQLTTFKDKLRHALTFFGPKSNSCTNACELPKEAIGFKL